MHFATHGVFNNESPGLSGIVLSMFDKRGEPQDGFLRMHDIYLKLPADLVVLSACNTALGKPVRAKDWSGWSGVSCTPERSGSLASLWKVDDEATGELMTRFYRAMWKEGRRPRPRCGPLSST